MKTTITRPTHIESLSFGQIPHNAQLIMSMAPLNSSGDIYHIIALVLLLRHHNKPVPEIQLRYDVTPAPPQNNKRVIASKITVGNQVQRSYSFVATLGLHQHFSQIEQGKKKLFHECVRHKILIDDFRNTAQSTKKIIAFVDQMAATTMVARYVQELGYKQATDIIRSGFQHRNIEYFPNSVQKLIDESVQRWSKEIDDLSEAENQPLLLCNLRHSSRANNKQNMPDSFLKELFRVLHTRSGYQIVLVVADDRAKRVDYGANASKIITPFKEQNFFKNGVDYAKQAHLQLMLAMQQKLRTRAVIGNTSGTLDLAAFIGLQTYSIHQFGEGKISYQECRLYLQMAFMSVDALIKNAKSYELSQNIEDWLQKPQVNHGPKQWSTNTQREVTKCSIRAQRQKVPFSKMFSVSLFTPNSQEDKYDLPAALSFLQ